MEKFGEKWTPRFSAALIVIFQPFWVIQPRFPLVGNRRAVTEVLPFQVKFPNLFSIYRNSGKTNGMKGGGRGFNTF